MSPKPFTEEEKKIVHSKLIEAALKKLATTGIKKTTVEELAQAVGISKGAFYLFYESKELLFFDALESIQSQIHQMIISEIKKHKNKKDGFIGVIIKMYEDFLPVLTILSNDEYEILLRRVPQERIAQHIEIDDAASRLFAEEFCNREIDPELLSAVLRMLMLGMLHRNEVGKAADDAFLFMLQAVADKIFTEGQP